MLVEMFLKLFFRNHIYWDACENLILSAIWYCYCSNMAISNLIVHIRTYVANRDGQYTIFYDGTVFYKISRYK